MQSSRLRLATTLLARPTGHEVQVVLAVAAANCPAEQLLHVGENVPVIEYEPAGHFSPVTPQPLDPWGEDFPVGQEAHVDEDGAPVVAKNVFFGQAVHT